MRRFVTPVIAEVELRQLSRLHFAKVLDAAPTASVAFHLRRCSPPWWPQGWRRPCCWPRRTCCGRCTGRRRPRAPRGPIEDVSPLLGHSTVRVTQGPLHLRRRRPLRAVL